MKATSEWLKTQTKFWFEETVPLCFLLFVLVVWTFWPATNGAFQYFDENAYIISNLHVNSGLTWDNFLWSFTDLGRANWFPLTLISHMLDVQIYGSESWGHHLTNILLHALNTILVLLVFQRLIGVRWQALIVALLFGLHPLRVEPVAWISERKDLLCALFWLLGIICYVRFKDEQKKPVGKSKLFYGLTLLFFVLGLMSKQMIVTLPFVFLLLDFWPLNCWQQNKWRLILEKSPFFLLAFVASIVVYIAKQKQDVLQWMDLSIGARIENAFVSYIRYLGKFFWPENLCVYYPHPGHWPVLLVIFAVLFVLGISTFAWLRRKQIPYFFVGWFWYMGTLVPVIGLVQLYSLSMADCYTYVPMIGIFMILAVALNRTVILWKKPMVIIITLTMILCIGLTRHQITFWKDGQTLWAHAANVTSGNYVAHNNLGILIMDSQPDAARDEFQKAIRINPDFNESRKNMAVTLIREGNWEGAIEHLEKSLQLDTASAWTWHAIGMYYIHTDAWRTALPISKKRRK